MEFQSTHPVRGATGSVSSMTIHLMISIHAPRAGCDKISARVGKIRGISIHAPRAGCDMRRTMQFLSSWNFNPRTPCGVRLQGGTIKYWTSADFNPRTPCGVRPEQIKPKSRPSQFQSTHPVRGATARQRVVAGAIRISIHAPRAGCDARPARPSARSTVFQSTHPVRGATYNPSNGGNNYQFQSTHPVRGATPFPRCRQWAAYRFQSTHPVRGATHALAT